MKVVFFLICILFTLKKEAPAAQAGANYNFVQHGKSSYYANALTGRTTASGVPYHPDSLMAAHRYLPLGTRIKVTNTRNGRQISVVVKDRGPFHPGRVLDLSRSAADSLEFLLQGITEVKIEAALSLQDVVTIEQWQARQQQPEGERK